MANMTVASSKATATMSINVYYTPQFASVTSDIPGWVAQVMAETNQGYANSKIPLRAEVHCIQQASVNDASSSTQQINEFGSMMGSVDALRNTADVAILFIRQMGGICGRAADIYSIPSQNNYAFATKGCSLGYYSFGHEIAHLFGAGHNQEAHGGYTNSVYSYGHGFLIPGGYRSIMGYNYPGHSFRVNYYSNPNVNYQGSASGTSSANNAKVISDNRFAMAAVGDESGSCPGEGKLFYDILLGRIW